MMETVCLMSKMQMMSPETIFRHTKLTEVGHHQKKNHAVEWRNPQGEVEGIGLENKVAGSSSLVATTSVTFTGATNLNSSIYAAIKAIHLAFSSDIQS